MAKVRPRVPGPPHDGHGEHAIDQRRRQEPHDRHGQDQRRHGQEHVGDPHQHEFGPAAYIACNQANHHAHRHCDHQHRRAENQRQPVGEQDAAEQVAPDQVRSEQVGRLRRLVGVDEIDHRPGVLRKRRHDIGAGGGQRDQQHQPQPDHRRRPAIERGPDPPGLSARRRRVAHDRRSASRIRGLIRPVSKSTRIFTIRNAEAMISTVPTIAFRSLRRITCTP